MTFQSAHWNRNQSFDYPVDSQYVPTYLGSILCVSSYAIACCSAGWYLPHPAVASSPFGSAAWPTPASCFPFIVIAISFLTMTVTFCFLFFLVPHAAYCALISCQTKITMLDEASSMAILVATSTPGCEASSDATLWMFTVSGIRGCDSSTTTLLARHSLLRSRPADPVTTLSGGAAAEG